METYSIRKIMNGEEQAHKTCPEKGGHIEADGLVWSQGNLSADLGKIPGIPMKRFSLCPWKGSFTEKLTDCIE